MHRLLLIIIAVIFFINRNGIGFFVVTHSTMAQFRERVEKSIVRDKEKAVDYSGVLMFPGAYNFGRLVFTNEFEGFILKTDFTAILTDMAMFEVSVKAGHWMGFDEAAAGHSQKDMRVIEPDNFLLYFAGSPSVGHRYYIELLTDIPYDNDEEDEVNVYKTYAGHSFIQLSSRSPWDTVIRTIGLYPQDPVKAMAVLAPVPELFADNSGHEYNASIKMEIDRESFFRAIAAVRSDRLIHRYDLQSHNCTNFAIGIYNTAVPNDGILIHKTHLVNLSLNTPADLYAELKRRKMEDLPSAQRIQVGIKKRAD